MKILYVANHDSGGNDDEGAIAYALSNLGHEVVRVQERRGASSLLYRRKGIDLLLFHKWSDIATLRAFEGVCPRVFWYFDLVDWPCESVRGRSLQRIKWMNDVPPNVEFGFCTDGDWVAEDSTGKLRWLPQGADERVVGVGVPCDDAKKVDLFFAGIGQSGGKGRASFVEAVRERYGGRFLHVERGLYGRDLANQIASSKIVLCPDSPVTDRYWSNRVYNMLGFGAFVLHPYCEKLSETVSSVTFYLSRDNLFDAIDYCLPQETQRKEMSRLGFAEVRSKHLYRYRLEQLLNVVRGIDA